MPEESQGKHTEYDAVLLDISLFVLDLLSPEKISSNYQNVNFVLEVPGAFVTMVLDALAGNLLLKNFIYAHLISIRNNPKHQSSPERRIQEIVTATENELLQKTEIIHSRIIQSFSPLISGAVDEKIKPDDTGQSSNIHYISTTTDGISTQYPYKHPILRYEPIMPVSNESLQKLREAYQSELNISVHPLIDLYYLQVFHAQTYGFSDASRSKRDLVSVGRSTLEPIIQWQDYSLKVLKQQASIQHLQQEETKKYYSTIPAFDVIGAQNTHNAKFDGLFGDARTKLGQVVQNFFDAGWISPVTAVAQIAVDVVISVAETGALGPGTFVLAIVGFASAELIQKGVEVSAKGEPWKGAALILAGIVILLFVCLIFQYIRGTNCSDCIETPTPPSPLSSPEGPLLPTNTSPLPVITNTAPIPSPTIFVTPQDIPFSMGYCAYAIQPGDTIQSVASRFQVTEADLRLNNWAVNAGKFISTQLIRINADCCKPTGKPGISYTVQYGDTVYSLSNKFSTSVNAIVEANYLYSAQYIQTGQMLCIPIPPIPCPDNLTKP